jgi:hypothetical protein
MRLKSDLRRVVVVAPLALVACAGASSAPTEGPSARPAAAAMGDTLWLPLGATARLSGGGTLAFVARGDDSRCPANALCVWEGDAAITVRATAAGAGAGERVLRTNRRFGSDTITVGGTGLRLVGLLPFPIAGAPPAPSRDVVAVLIPAGR